MVGFIVNAMLGVEMKPELHPATLFSLSQIPGHFIPYPTESPPEPAVSFTDDGFVMSKPDGEQQIPVSLDVPTISWPVAASLDKQGHRIYSVSMGGENYVYLYDLATATWSVAACMAEVDASGMLFDPSNNRLLMSVNYFDYLLLATSDAPHPQSYEGMSEIAR